MSIPPDPRAAGGVHKHVSLPHQVVHGDVTINVGATEGGQSLQTPPRNLPPRQFATFAGRERELRDLHACFAHEAVVGVTQQAAVHSHGGVGKTSLAIEYGWRHLDDYPGGVFFLSCERAPVPPLAELAPYLGLRADGNAEETAALVKARLEAGSPSLLILDNVEGPTQWLGGRWNRLLPQSPCRRLVTTRATRLGDVNMLPLDRLSAEDGLQLLANFREDARENPQSAARIVEWFDGLAVGLTVVGVYMQMNPLLSWKAYANDLEGRGLETVRETEAEIGEAIEYEGRAGSVFDDVLGALSAAERRTLEYAALLPEDNIFAPWLLVLLQKDEVEVPVLPGYADSPAQRIVDSLISRQLLRPRGEDNRILGLHRVLRRHLAERMSSGLLEPLLDRIVELAQERGRGSQELHTNFDIRGELTPLIALAEVLAERGRGADGIRLTNWVSQPLSQMGRYAEARVLLERFIGLRSHVSIVPQENASLIANLAGILKEQGDLSLARYWMEQAIEIDEQHLQPDHPILADRYSDLAAIHRLLGNYPEARFRMEEAIRISRRHVSPNHPTLATLYSDLAIILADQGELTLARHYMEHAITIAEEHFQPDHPTLAATYSNMATILEELGELSEARRRTEQAISILQKFQPDHPFLATSYSNLAVILRGMGEVQEARRRMKQAIAIEEQHFSADHPTLAASYNNLGDIERKSGDAVAACTLYRRADAILRKHFPPEHPHRQIISRKLAEFCGGKS